MQKYWFRQKRFGYGATPSTWEGWALTIAVILLCTGLSLIVPYIKDNRLELLLAVLGTVLVVTGFCYIAWRKTEGGWRWRNGD